jgi:hypothetical protein
MSMLGMTMTATTDIGYAKQKQYAVSNRRRHAVKKDDRERWITVCTQKPSTREYKGWVTSVNCQKCREELGVTDE